MTPEPLKGKKNTWCDDDMFDYKDVHSALEWMIQIHEEKIEELICQMKKNVLILRRYK